MWCVSARSDAIIRKAKAERSLQFMLDTTLWIENYIKMHCIHSSSVFSQLRVKVWKILHAVTGMWEHCSALRTDVPEKPHCTSLWWMGWNQKAHQISWLPGMLYFHSHTKPKWTKPCTHFIHILCYEYELHIWRVSKIFTVYTFWKIVSLSAADLFTWAAPGQIG